MLQTYNFDLVERIPLQTAVTYIPIKEWALKLLFFTFMLQTYNFDLVPTAKHRTQSLMSLSYILFFDLFGHINIVGIIIPL